jgi:hypothetical protein
MWSNGRDREGIYNMAEKTISGDPEMIRIAKEFTDLAVQAVSSRFGKTDCEMDGAALALRLLTQLLIDNGAIDREVLQANGELWIEKINGRTEKNKFHNQGAALVFASILGLDLNAPQSPDNPTQRFEVIKGGKT